MNAKGDVVSEDHPRARLVARLEALGAQREALEAELKTAQPVPRLPPRVVESRLAEWRRILRQGTTQTRQVLGRVLAGKITFRPRPDGLVEF